MSLTRKEKIYKYTDYLTSPSGSVFTISAVINHIGETPKEGHYNIMLYDKINELYFSLDDRNIASHSSRTQIELIILLCIIKLNKDLCHAKT